MGFLDNIFGNKKKKIEAGLQKDPTVAKVLELSALYEDDGDITSALRLLRAWSKKFNDEKLNSVLQDVEVRERNVEIESLQSRIHDAPNPLNFSRLASLKIKSGELDDAMSICKESLEKFPQFNSGAHQCMGDIFLIKEDYDNAAGEYELVIKEDANNFKVIKHLCEIYIYRGKLDKAVKYLEDLIKHNPGDQALKDMLDRAKAGEQLVEEKVAEEPVAQEAIEPEKIMVAPAAVAPPIVGESREPSTNRQISIDAKILVTDPEGKVTEMPLEVEEFVIGRHKNADLSIDDGKNFISRKHACIKRVDNNYQLSDMGSGNGTYLNDNKLSGVHNLNNNDVVKVGYYTIVYVGPSAGGGMNDDFDMTMIEDSDATIVGQDFSYLDQPATNLNKISVDDEVQRLSAIDGVRHVLVINSSGFPVHSVSNEEGLNDQMAAALMSNVFSLAQADTDRIGTKLVTSCDIKTKTHSVYVYGCSNGSVAAIIGTSKCLKGQVDIEIQNLLKGI